MCIRDRIERYLKVSGLFGRVDPASEMAASGVRAEAGQWRLAADPAINAVAGPALAPVIAAMQAPLRLAAGSEDAMVSAADMQAFDRQARLIEGAGHNAQVDQPAALGRLIAEELR